MEDPGCPMRHDLVEDRPGLAGFHPLQPGVIPMAQLLMYLFFELRSLREEKLKLEKVSGGANLFPKRLDRTFGAVTLRQPG